jgi:hypothetical protein
MQMGTKISTDESFDSTLQGTFLLLLSSPALPLLLVLPLF